MPVLEATPAADAKQWNSVLEQSYLHDFYHTASYHRLAHERGEGSPWLFVYSDSQYFLALPLLVRDLPGGLRDATSVYGYAGPIASHESIPGHVAARFRGELMVFLREQGVVTVFSRLHPFLPQAAWLEGLGECVPTGQTVSIDTTAPLEEQRAAFRGNHKLGLNRLRRLGFTVVEDTRGDHVDEFALLYHETMTRVHASGEYFFDTGYFRKLLAAPESYMHFFLVLQEGQPVCGGFFSAVDGIVQYHLGGTGDRWVSLAPMKLLLDEVRIWATGHRRRVFHLGGGVGSQQDSLFGFKAGFSRIRHTFSVWRWVVMEQPYAELCRERRESLAVPEERMSHTFFPYYRQRVEYDFRKVQAEAGDLRSGRAD